MRCWGWRQFEVSWKQSEKSFTFQGAHTYHWSFSYPWPNNQFCQLMTYVVTSTCKTLSEVKGPSSNDFFQPFSAFWKTKQKQSSSSHPPDFFRAAVHGQMNTRQCLWQCSCVTADDHMCCESVMQHSYGSCDHLLGGDDQKYTHWKLFLNNHWPTDNSLNQHSSQGKPSQDMHHLRYAVFQPLLKNNTVTNLEADSAIRYCPNSNLPFPGKTILPTCLSDST